MPDVSAIIPLILSGGLMAAIAALITSRAMAGKTRAEAAGVNLKTPVEVDSIIVQGAEAAVLTMRSALDYANKRITELESDREADRRRITELELRLDQLRSKVDDAEAALIQARDAGQHLREELSQLRRDSDSRS